MSSVFPLKTEKTLAQFLPYMKAGDRIRFICENTNGDTRCEISKDNSLSDPTAGETASSPSQSSPRSSYDEW